MQRAWLDAATEEEMRRYLPALAFQFAASGRAGEYLSGRSINDVAVTAALARTAPRAAGPLTILDPAVGTGAMLFSVARTVASLGYAPEALGQDVNSEVALFAAATLFLGEVESRVHIGDSLIVDPFADIAVDIAVSQPPFGVSWARQADGVRHQRNSAGWYRFGLPPQSDSSWLFASRLIEKLRPPEDGGGRAVMFMAPSSLHGRGAEDGIRRAVLEQDIVDAIIGLPGRLSPLTDILLYAVVFANKKPEDRQGKIQVINLRPYFETSRDRQTAPRALSPDALDVLGSALRSVRPGVASRTVPLEHFIRRQVRVHVHREAQALVPTPDQQLASWDVYVPATGSTDTYLARRYGPVEVHADATNKLYCPLEIDSLFDNILAKVSRWSGEQHWPTTRLSALLVAPPAVLSAAEESSNEPVVLVPTSARGDATSGRGIIAPSSGRTLQLQASADVISADFLAAWLNSPLGRDCRRRAYDLGSSGTVIAAVRSDQPSLMRYVDELVVPVPPMTSQEAVVAAEVRLTAVSRIVDGSRRELWTAPIGASQAARRFDPLFDESLAAWAGSMPFPMASAMWTLEAKHLNVDAAHKQVFLVWEAFAAFMGIVLLSALAQDPVLRESEVPALRQALSKEGLSMERATLGTWSVIVQRLSSCFRAMLQSEDTDERVRVLQIFGSPSYDALARLLGTSVVQLVSDANSKRNLWDGHTGAVATTELEEHLDYLLGRLKELRDITGTAWLELQCVRAGDGFKQLGDLIQKVELATGPNTPFRQAEIGVGELMEKGELYLTTDGAPLPLPLQHLLVLRGSPEGASYTCYFYNRLDGSDVRLISYHIADRSELTEHLEDVLGALRGFIGPMPDPGEP